MMLEVIGYLAVGYMVAQYCARHTNLRKEDALFWLVVLVWPLVVVVVLVDGLLDGRDDDDDDDDDDSSSEVYV